MTTEKITTSPTTAGWTHFWDMNSGGGQKLDFKHIFIELPEEAAKAYFAQRFGRDPDHVTCACCGEDYAVHSADTLDELTKYHREHNPDFMDQPDVLVARL